MLLASVISADTGGLHIAEVIATIITIGLTIIPILIYMHIGLKRVRSHHRCCHRLCEYRHLGSHHIAGNKLNLYMMHIRKDKR